jgi:hypothetical protein
MLVGSLYMYFGDKLLFASLQPTNYAAGYLDGTGRELMVCRKVMRSRTSHYIFSLKAEDLWRKREQRSRLYLGKLRATSAQDYVLYDNGICEAPEDPEALLQDRERDGGGAFSFLSVLFPL